MPVSGGLTVVEEFVAGSLPLNHEQPAATIITNKIANDAGC
jgi:hypothetical protein